MQRKEYFEGWNDYVKGLEEKSNNIYYKEGYNQAKGFEKINNKKPFSRKYQSKIKLFFTETLFLLLIKTVCLLSFVITFPIYYFILKKSGKNNNSAK